MRYKPQKWHLILSTKKHICRCADKYRNNGSNKQLADHLQIETLLPWRGFLVLIILWIILVPRFCFFVWFKWSVLQFVPPRPCNREATELRTAYPHHGNLTPPRISPSRFREYHYHPGCHRLHEKLSHGLWRDSRSSLRYPVWGWRIMAYLTSGYHQDWCLSACIFSFQCSAEVSEKRSLYLYK